MLGLSIAVALAVTTAPVPRTTATPTTSSQLRSVRLRPADGSIQVVFGMTSTVRYKSTRTTEPARITIDLLQMGISPLFTKRELLSVHPALIRVLITRSAGATRAVLDLAAAGSHTIYSVSGELIVEINTRKSSSNARAPVAPLAASPLAALSAALPEGISQRHDSPIGPPE